MRKINAGKFLFLGIVLIVISFGNLSAQKKTAKKAVDANPWDSEVIAKVGNENITYGELERAFKKNMNRKDVHLYQVSRDSLMDFLNLYINYRLKVNDAVSRKFDKDSSVLADINQNRKILAESYFYDKKLVEPAVAKMLKMREHEMQIAIVLISLPPGNNPDTTASYRKAKATLELIKNGKDFAMAAKDSSDDKESANRGGLITTYITAGSVQRPIEQAVYSLKPGEVYKDVISTRYGYFIVKLVKDEPRIKLKARQILLAESMEKDSAGTFKRADSLAKALRSGSTDFNAAAEKFSDDPSSAMKGGDLGAWYSRASGFDNNSKHLVPAFEEAMFQLKPGQVSNPVLTEYGYHVIRVDSVMNVDVSAEKEELKKLYKRLYLEQDKRNLLDSLRKNYSYEIVQSTMNELISALDTTKSNLDSAWTKNITSALNPKTLYKFNGKNTTVEQFISMMNKKTELRGMSTNREGLRRAIDKMVDPAVFDLASANLENEYPDFASLMKEFRDGILLFRVEALEVWDKLKFDSVLARQYFDTTQKRYLTAPMYDMTEIYVLTDSLARQVYQKAVKGEDFEQLAVDNTQRSGYREKKGNWGKVSLKDNKLAKLAQENGAAPGKILEPLSFEKGFSIIKVNSIEPPRPKTFEEAIPDFAPEFQDLMQKNLSEKWLSRIKANFPVKIMNSEFDKALSELKKNHKD